MTDQQMFARWKAPLGDTSDIPWTAPEYMGGFFQRFRPHGEGLAAAFEGVVGADEILPRLMEIYPVTAEGWRTENAYDAYFIARKPKPLPEDQAKHLASLHLQKVTEMARAIGRKELVPNGIAERNRNGIGDVADSAEINSVPDSPKSRQSMAPGG